MTPIAIIATMTFGYAPETKAFQRK